MQFNSETNNQDIVTMTRRLTKTKAVAFSLEDIVMYSNQALRIIWSWIFQVYGGWHYDDSNQTTLPEATSTLATGVQFYKLPFNSAHLMGVAYKDTQGNSTKLTPITLEQIQAQSAETEFMKTAGNPVYYRPVADGFKIYPAANFTVTDTGIEIKISRDVVGFTPSSTTQTPGFASEFHEAVPTFNALQYAKINVLPNRKDLQRDWDGDEDSTGKEGGYKKSIKNYYLNRYRQMFPPRKNVSDVVHEYM